MVRLQFNKHLSSTFCIPGSGESDLRWYPCPQGGPRLVGETGDETNDSRHRQPMGSPTQRNQGGLPRGGDSARIYRRRRVGQATTHVGAPQTQLDPRPGLESTLPGTFNHQPIWRGPCEEELRAPGDHQHHLPDRFQPPAFNLSS